MTNLSYNQSRSFNLGIAQETSIEAALIFDEFSYQAQHTNLKDGWFYKTDAQLMERLPFIKKTVLREAIKLLVDSKWVIKKLAKVDGAPVSHYRISKILLSESDKSIELSDSDKSIYKEATTNTTTNIKKKKKKNSNKVINKSRLQFGGNQETTLVVSPPIPTPPPALLLERLIQLINPREKVTDERLRMLKGRLKTYTYLEVEQAALAFKNSQWHIDNHQMSIDNLLAPSKFGRWYAQIPAKADTYKLPTPAEVEAEKKKREEKDWGF